MKKYFIIYFYKHHKVSIFFIVFACSVLILTTSFLPNSLSIENSGNAYENIKTKLGSYFYCILFNIFFVGLSFIYSYSRVYSKVLMQIKFISPYKIIILFGVAGFPISIIASIVSYYIDYNDNIFAYFSSMKKVLNGEKIYKFWVEIFLVYPLYSFTSFMEIAFEFLTIYYLNPFYILMANSLYFGILELIKFLSNISNDGAKITHFLLTEFTEIFSFLGYMVFLEILELNFCGLSEKLKSKLAEKSDMEFKELLNIKAEKSDLYDDDDN